MVRQILHRGGTVALAVLICAGAPNSLAAAQSGPESDPAQSAQVQTSPPLVPVEARPLGIPREHHKPTGETKQVAIGEVARTVLSLAGVVALAVFASLVIRKIARASGGLGAAMGAGGRAPAGVLEVLGRYPIARGQSLVLLKLDKRVLLLSQCSGTKGGAGAIASLCEITDADEVASLLIKTRDAESTTLASRFEQTMGAAEREADLAGSTESDTNSRRTIVAPSGDRAELLNEGAHPRHVAQSNARGFNATPPAWPQPGARTGSESRPDVDAAAEVLRRRLLSLDKAKGSGGEE